MADASSPNKGATADNLGQLNVGIGADIEHLRASLEVAAGLVRGFATTAASTLNSVPAAFNFSTGDLSRVVQQLTAASAEVAQLKGVVTSLQGGLNEVYQEVRKVSKETGSDLVDLQAKISSVMLANREVGQVAKQVSDEQIKSAKKASSVVIQAYAQMRQGIEEYDLKQRTSAVTHLNAARDQEATVRRQVALYRSLQTLLSNTKAKPLKQDIFGNDPEALQDRKQTIEGIREAMSKTSAAIAESIFGFDKFFNTIQNNVDKGRENVRRLGFDFGRVIEIVKNEGGLVPDSEKSESALTRILNRLNELGISTSEVSDLFAAMNKSLKSGLQLTEEELKNFIRQLRNLEKTKDPIGAKKMAESLKLAEDQLRQLGLTDEAVTNGMKSRRQQLQREIDAEVRRRKELKRLAKEQQLEEDELARREQRRLQLRAEGVTGAIVGRELHHGRFLNYANNEDGDQYSLPGQKTTVTARPLAGIVAAEQRVIAKDTTKLTDEKIRNYGREGAALKKLGLDFSDLARVARQMMGVISETVRKGAEDVKSSSGKVAAAITNSSMKAREASNIFLSDQLTLGQKIKYSLDGIRKAWRIFSSNLRSEAGGGLANGIKYLLGFGKAAGKAREEADKLAGGDGSGGGGKKGGGLLDAFFDSTLGRVIKINAIWKIWNLTLQTTLEFIDQISQFDQKLKEIQAITLTTGDQAVEIGNSLRIISIATKFSAIEIADGFVKFSQAGFNAKESIDGINAASRLSIATFASLDESIKLITSTLKAYDKTGADSAEIANIFVAAINRSKLNLEGLNTAFNYAGPAAAAAGLSVEATAAALGVMADQGVRASTQGTGLRQVLAQLSAPTTNFQRVLDKLGVTTESINPQFNDLGDILRTLRDAGFSAQDAFQGLERRTATAFLSLVRNAEKFDIISDSLHNTAAAAVAAETQLTGLENRMAIINQRVLNLGINRFNKELKESAITSKEFLAISLQGIIDVTEYLTNYFSIYGSIRKNIETDPELFANSLAGIGRSIKDINGQIDETVEAIKKVQNEEQNLVGGPGRLLFNLIFGGFGFDAVYGSPTGNRSSFVKKLRDDLLSISHSYRDIGIEIQKSADSFRVQYADILIRTESLKSATSKYEGFIKQIDYYRKAVAESTEGSEEQRKVLNRLEEEYNSLALFYAKELIPLLGDIGVKVDSGNDAYENSALILSKLGAENSTLSNALRPAARLLADYIQQLRQGQAGLNAIAAAGENVDVQQSQLNQTLQQAVSRYELIRNVLGEVTTETSAAEAAIRSLNNVYDLDTKSLPNAGDLAAGLDRDAEGYIRNFTSIQLNASSLINALSQGEANPVETLASLSNQLFGVLQDLRDQGFLDPENADSLVNQLFSDKAKNEKEAGAILVYLQEVLRTTEASVDASIQKIRDRVLELQSQLSSQAAAYDREQVQAAIDVVTAVEGRIQKEKGLQKVIQANIAYEKSRFDAQLQSEAQYEATKRRYEKELSESQVRETQEQIKLTDAKIKELEVRHTAFGLSADERLENEKKLQLLLEEKETLQINLEAAKNGVIVAGLNIEKQREQTQEALNIAAQLDRISKTEEKLVKTKQDQLDIYSDYLDIVKELRPSLAQEIDVLQKQIEAEKTRLDYAAKLRRIEDLRLAIKVKDEEIRVREARGQERQAQSAKNQREQYVSQLTVLEETLDVDTQRVILLEKQLQLLEEQSAVYVDLGTALREATSDSLAELVFEGGSIGDVFDAAGQSIKDSFKDAFKQSVLEKFKFDAIYKKNMLELAGFTEGTFTDGFKRIFGTDLGESFKNVGGLVSNIAKTLGLELDFSGLADAVTPDGTERNPIWIRDVDQAAGKGTASPELLKVIKAAISTGDLPASVLDGYRAEDLATTIPTGEIDDPLFVSDRQADERNKEVVSTISNFSSRVSSILAAVLGGGGADIPSVLRLFQGGSSVPGSVATKGFGGQILGSINDITSLFGFDFSEFGGLLTGFLGDKGVSGTEVLGGLGNVFKGGFSNLLGTAGSLLSFGPSLLGNSQLLLGAGQLLGSNALTGIGAFSGIGQALYNSQLGQSILSNLISLFSFGGTPTYLGVTGGLTDAGVKALASAATSTAVPAGGSAYIDAAGRLVTEASATGPTLTGTASPASSALASAASIIGNVLSIYGWTVLASSIVSSFADTAIAKPRGNKETGFVAPGFSNTLNSIFNTSGTLKKLNGVWDFVEKADLVAVLTNAIFGNSLGLTYEGSVNLLTDLVGETAATGFVAGTPELALLLKTLGVDLTGENKGVLFSKALTKEFGPVFQRSGLPGFAVDVLQKRDYNRGTLGGATGLDSVTSQFARDFNISSTTADQFAAALVGVGYAAASSVGDLNNFTTSVTVATSALQNYLKGGKTFGPSEIRTLIENLAKEVGSFEALFDDFNDKTTRLIKKVNKSLTAPGRAAFEDIFKNGISVDEAADRYNLNIKDIQRLTDSEESIKGVKLAAQGIAVLFQSQIPAGIDLTSKALRQLAERGQIDIDGLLKTAEAIASSTQSSIGTIAGSVFSGIQDGLNSETALDSLKSSLDSFVTESVFGIFAQGVQSTLLEQGTITPLVDLITELSEQLRLGQISFEDFGAAIQDVVAFDIVPALSDFQNVFETVFASLASTLGLPLDKLPAFFSSEAGALSSNLAFTAANNGSTAGFKTNLSTFSALARRRTENVENRELFANGYQGVESALGGYDSTISGVSPQVEKDIEAVSSIIRYMVYTEFSAHILRTSTNLSNKQIAALQKPTGGFYFDEPSLRRAAEKLVKGEELGGSFLGHWKSSDNDDNCEFRVNGSLVDGLTFYLDRLDKNSPRAGNTEGLIPDEFAFAVPEGGDFSSEEILVRGQQLTDAQNARENVIRRVIENAGASVSEVQRKIGSNDIGSLSYEDLRSILDELGVTISVDDIDRAIEENREEILEALGTLSSAISTADEFLALYSILKDSLNEGIFGDPDSTVAEEYFRQLLEEGIASFEENLPDGIDIGRILQASIDEATGAVDVDEFNRRLESELSIYESLSEAITSAITSALSSGDIADAVSQFTNTFKKGIGDAVLQGLINAFVNEIILDQIFGDFFQEFSGLIAEGASLEDLQAFLTESLPGLSGPLGDFAGTFLEPFIEFIYQLFGDAGLLDAYDDTLSRQEALIDEQLAVARIWQDIVDQIRNVRAAITGTTDSAQGIRDRLSLSNTRLQEQLDIFRNPLKSVEARQAAASSAVQLVQDLFTLGTEAGGLGLPSFQRNSTGFQEFSNGLLAILDEIEFTALEGASQIEILQQQLDLLQQIADNTAPTDTSDPVIGTIRRSIEESPDYVTNYEELLSGMQLTIDDMFATISALAALNGISVDETVASPSVARGVSQESVVMNIQGDIVLNGVSNGKVAAEEFIKVIDESVRYGKLNNTLKRRS